MSEIVYSRIPLDRAKDVSRLLESSFFVDEPLGTALGLNVREVSRWLQEYIECLLKHEVSFMAVDSNTNEIVGASVNMIHYKGGVNVSMGDYIDPSKEPVMTLVGQFFNQLCGGIDAPNDPERILRLLFLNVHVAYGGRGIAKKLTLQSQECGLSLNIHDFTVTTTSEFSFSIYNKLGFKILNQIKYSEFEHNGIKILDKVDMGIHQYSRLLYQNLNN